MRRSPTLRVLPRVLAFGLVATGICVTNSLIHPELGIEVGPQEVAGGVLGLVLVFRTNSGYDRWWEARRLWGGITNQCRNLAAAALAYGPAAAPWRERFVRLLAVFPFVARDGLRAAPLGPEVAGLVGFETASELAAARHPPTAVSLALARLLQEALNDGMDPRSFQQMDGERLRLLDHLGGCERIQKTPLPQVYAIVIRRFITLFLVTLPFALILKINWLTPLATMLVAYPVLVLDQVGVELQDPFALQYQSHLPLDRICVTIEADLRALLSPTP